MEGGNVRCNSSCPDAQKCRGNNHEMLQSEITARASSASAGSTPVAIAAYMLEFKFKVFQGFTMGSNIEKT